MTVAVCASFVSACTTPPRVTYDSTKMSTIKTIAVAAPQKTHYFAVNAGSGSYMVIGGGVLASVIATAVANTVAAGSTHATFDDIVTAKLGDTGLNRKLFDALEAELKNAGYDVKEVDLSGEDMPKVAVRRDGTQVLKGHSYAGADAIMVVQNDYGYFAPGSFAWYARDARVSIAMYNAATLEPIFNEHLRFHKGNADPYHYTAYSELTGDLPHAIQGVDEAAMGLVPEFRADLLTSRGVTAKTVRTATTPESAQKVETAQKSEPAKAD